MADLILHETNNFHILIGNIYLFYVASLLQCDMGVTQRVAQHTQSPCNDMEDFVMTTPNRLRWTVMAALLTMLLTAGAAVSEELVVTSCPELLRMADSCRDDIRAADTMLGSAIDAGSLEMIKNFKLRKEAARKHLDSVIKALELKGCVKTR
jgi:hypothetical protein